MNTCTTLCRTLEILPAAQGGTYIVMLWLPARRQLTIGRLGTHDLPRGYYSYVGSAKRGLASRLHRHLHGATTRHWHLDYLRPHVRVMAWRAYPDHSQPECQLAQRLLAWGQIVIPRFGASDCSCPAHLLYYPRRSDVESGLRHAEFSMGHEASDKNAWRGINKIK
jgi:Uri superfamily endonuclease